MSACAGCSTGAAAGGTAAAGSGTISVSADRTVTGSVTINAAEIAPIAGYTITGPDTFTVIANDERDRDPGQPPSAADLIRAAVPEVPTIGVVLGSGLGDFAGKVWRIGLMGQSCSERHVELVLNALAKVSGRSRSISRVLEATV